MIRRISVAAVSIALVGSLTACVGGQGDDPGGDGPLDSFTLVMSGDYDYLDPAKVTNIFGNQLIVGMYERLIGLDADNQFIPGLAESWETSPTEATFVLRDDAVCSDGTQLTASMAAASLQRYADPETSSPYRARVFGTGDVEVVGDDDTNEVHITMTEPFSEMLVGLAMPWTSIICPAGLEDVESLEAQPNGTGPYVLDSDQSVRGNEYVLTLRDDYSGDSSGLPGEIVVRVITDTSTIANELGSGSVDAAQVTPDQIEILEGSNDLIRTDAQAFGSYFFMFRQDEGYLFNDERLREALALSVDREALAQAATRGAGSAATSYLGGTVPCAYDEVHPKATTFDEARAAELFEEAGYARNSSGDWEKDGEQLVVRLVASSNNAPAGTEFLSDELRKSGIDVQVQQYPISEFVGTIGQTNDWDLAIFPSQPPIPSPNSATSFLENAADGSPGINSGRVDNPEFSQFVRDAWEVDIQDPNRCEPWLKSQLAILDEVNASPLITPANVWFSKEEAGELPFIGPGTLELTKLNTSK